MSRLVRGVLFSDYVRMLRGRKQIDWSGHLAPEDLPYLEQHIDPDGWYPMQTFERMGNAILARIAGGSLEAVRMWGRLSVDQLGAAQPHLVARGDPVETVSRFRVLRSTYFDFDALEVILLHEDEAKIVIRYHMGMPAEEAASIQTLGFFERLLQVAGADAVWAKLVERSWAGDPRTVLHLRWDMPAK